MGVRNPAFARGATPAHVIVEAAGAVAPVLEEVEGGAVPEVLELEEQSAPEAHLRRLHELVHQGVVLIAAQAGLAEADVQRVLADGLHVAAHVEGDGEHLGRGKSGGSRGCRAAAVQLQVPWTGESRRMQRLSAGTGVKGGEGS